MTPDQDRPQPVVDAVTAAAELATKVSAFAKGIGAGLVLLGITTQDEVANWVSVLGLVVVSGGELASYVYTRIRLRSAATEAAEFVTPLSSPRDDRGVALVPADSRGRHAAKDGLAP